MGLLAERWEPAGTSQDYRLQRWEGPPADDAFCKDMEEGPERERACSEPHSTNCFPGILSCVSQSSQQPSDVGNYCNLYNIEGDIAARDAEEVAGGHIGREGQR